MVLLLKFIYRMGLHRDILSHAKFSKTVKFFLAQPVETLEIGSGGGVFSIELLSRGNSLTVVEIDKKTAEKTEEKIKQYFHRAKAKILIGHANEVGWGGLYRQVVLLETLEHILDNKKLLTKISGTMVKGSSLIISTPTASWGLLSSDSISSVEDDGHVRVGYDGSGKRLISLSDGRLTMEESKQFVSKIVVQALNRGLAGSNNYA